MKFKRCQVWFQGMNALRSDKQDQGNAMSLGQMQIPIRKEKTDDQKKTKTKG